MSKAFPFIFPHVSKKKQTKEIPYIYCYNIRIVRNTDKESKEYAESISHFINQNKHNLVNWNDTSNANRFYKRIAENDHNTDKSIYWDIKYVSPETKKELDDLLFITKYPKQVDKYGYIFEGCYNDDKLFIGGRNDMIINYCKLFPNTSYCKSFASKSQQDRLDEWAQKIFDDPEALDIYAEKWMKSFSL